MSVGLQRGMLVAGLVLTAAFLLTALLAPLIAPFGFAQISDAQGNFPTQQPPGGRFIWGTTVGGYDVLLPHPLGRADRGLGHRRRGGLLHLRRRVPGPGLRLHRRLA